MTTQKVSITDEAFLSSFPSLVSGHSNAISCFDTMVPLAALRVVSGVEMGCKPIWGEQAEGLLNLAVFIDSRVKEELPVIS
jgi:hypothetical protein